MLFIHTRVIGTGNDNDPFRVNFPTYELVEIDYVAMRALIRVPDGVLPDGLPTQAFNHPDLAPGGIQVLLDNAGTRRALETHIARDYKESHPGWQFDDIA
jgi:hypothetical protein